MYTEKQVEKIIAIACNAYQALGAPRTTYCASAELKELRAINKKASKILQQINKVLK